MPLFSRAEHDFRPVELGVYASAPDKNGLKQVAFTYDGLDLQDPIKKLRVREIGFSYKAANQAGFVTTHFATAGIISYHRTQRLKGLPKTIQNLDTGLIETQPQGFYGYIGKKLTYDLASIALSESEEEFYTVVPLNFHKSMPGKLHEPAIDWPV